MNTRVIATWLALTSPWVIAQSDKDEDRSTWDSWYQIEVVVFSHNTGSTMEQWPRRPDLQYPVNALRVGTGPTSTSPAELPQFLTIEDTIRRPDVDLDAAAEAAVESNPGEEVTAPVLLRLPRAWNELSKQEREMVARSRQINRRDAYTVLYSKAWRQVILPEQLSRPIIVESVHSRGNYPQLQGSITLSRSRYLHLSTNLWLNTDAPYYDDDWQMQAPPLSAPTPSLQMDSFEVLLTRDWNSPEENPEEPLASLETEDDPEFTLGTAPTYTLEEEPSLDTEMESEPENNPRESYDNAEAADGTETEQDPESTGPSDGEQTPPPVITVNLNLDIELQIGQQLEKGLELDAHYDFDATPVPGSDLHTITGGADSGEADK